MVLFAQERDPFLSPFEPKKSLPKETLPDKPVEPDKQETKTSILDAKAVAEIKKYLGTNQPDKAETLFAEFKKTFADKTLNETDQTIVSDFEDQIKNFAKYKELIKTTKELMTIQGKILLKDKKSILLINNQPVAEGEDLMDLLKLESSIFLHQVQEESFALRYKDIISVFRIE